MQELWIIDGYNLIRRDERLRQVESEQGTGPARALLEAQLLHVRTRRGPGLVIVLAYDGAPEAGAARSRKGLRIVHPQAGRSADDVVLVEARKAEGRATVRVVTSDFHDIARRLRGLRVEHVSTEGFAKELWKGSSASSDGVEKPEKVSGSEVDFWLGEFGEEE